VIDAFELQERQAVQAEGQAAAHRDSIAEQAKTLATATAVAARLTRIPVEPLQLAFDEAFAAYAVQNEKVVQLGYALQELKNERVEVVRLLEASAGRIAAARARVVEYTNDIKTMEFNNELVKKLKSMKPIVTDFLWGNVLAAVSNYFSQLRGEQSIVTKDATGFKVNGRGGSLSGSTLDVLALSIRVALSKTFVPHASFLVLDEPCHGADETRTGSILGFLQGAGFEQTILASHDPLSESVADNVIQLGV